MNATALVSTAERARPSQRWTCSAAAPATAPSMMRPMASARRAQNWPFPPASRDSDASAVMVEVTTTVVTSVTFRCRAVAACSPIISASVDVTTLPAGLAAVHPGHAGEHGQGGKAQRHGQQGCGSPVGPARRSLPEGAAPDGGTEHEAAQRECGAQDGQVGAAGKRHAQQHHVACHIAGKHAVQAQVAHGVHHTRGEGQGEHEGQVHAGGGGGNAGRHRKFLARGLEMKVYEA